MLDLAEYRDFIHPGSGALPRDYDLSGKNNQGGQNKNKKIGDYFENFSPTAVMVFFVDYFVFLLKHDFIITVLFIFDNKQLDLNLAVCYNVNKVTAKSLIMLKNFFVFAWELIKIVVVSLLIIIPVRYYIIQPFYVKGASMEPSFYDHEYLIIDEVSYRLREPQRGEVIVFRYPKNPQEYFIKRVVALPGEKIQMKEGAVYIYNADNPQGFKLEEPYLAQDVRTYNTSEEIISLAPDEFFVLGDNRNSSKDSRSFGPLNRSFVTGRVLLRGWPFDRAGLLESPTY